MIKVNRPNGITIRLLTVVGALGLFLFLPSLHRSGPTVGLPVSAAGAGKYIGSKKCENCHKAEASGDQYGAWAAAGHSKAFETLKGKQAKEIGAKQGIEDPSKSSKCLKCHVTGFGLEKKLFKKSFKVEQGVGCESCHGPGDAHAKARFRAANEEDDEEGFGDEEEAETYIKIPEGEILSGASVETCLECHTKESPTFKPFCFFHRAQKIQHLNPLKPRTKAEKEAYKGCDCKDEFKCDHTCTEKCGGKAKEEK